VIVGGGTQLRDFTLKTIVAEANPRATESPQGKEHAC